MQTELVHSVEMIAKGDMVVAAHKSRKGGFEPMSLALWRELCRWCPPDSVMIDGGAYTGLYSITAAQIGAQCIGFEANPEVWRRAMDNVALQRHLPHGNPMILNLALSDKRGQLELGSKGGLTSASTAHPQQTTYSRTITANATTLDDTFGHLDVFAIKLDVERHEIFALTGAKKIIKRDRPHILIEILDDKQMAEILTFFERLGGYTWQATDKTMWHFKPD